MADEKMILLSDVSKVYKIGENVVKALDHANMHVNKGEFVSVIGPSGSGKSTAAKLQLRNHIRNGYQIVAVDPEGEITEMTKMYGGEVVDLGKGLRNSNYN